MACLFKVAVGCGGVRGSLFEAGEGRGGERGGI